jgi:hypothetical protein
MQVERTEPTPEMVALEQLRLPVAWRMARVTGDSPASNQAQCAMQLHAAGPATPRLRQVRLITTAPPTKPTR